jgi:pyruvate-ferredoxin/flavodoxin oxidoreductase
VLASGRNVNVLVLDTQVYSNTGGQASKATPRGAVAKFAAGGKAVPRKDLGQIASAYGHVYVAQVAMGGDDAQTVRALLEADAWEGPSLVIAYSTCIAHGIDMSRSMSRQRDAVRSGFWPLWRFHPGLDPHRPFSSTRASLLPHEFTRAEARGARLRTPSVRGSSALASDADERWRLYQQLTRVELRCRTTSEGTPPAEEPTDDRLARPGLAPRCARRSWPRRRR